MKVWAACASVFAASSTVSCTNLGAPCNKCAGFCSSDQQVFTPINGKINAVCFRLVSDRLNLSGL